MYCIMNILTIRITSSKYLQSFLQVIETLLLHFALMLCIKKIDRLHIATKTKQPFLLESLYIKMIKTGEQNCSGGKGIC